MSDPVRKTALAEGGEFDLIRRFLARAPLGDGVRVGPGDDCAVIDGDIAFSTDLSIEGVHFRREWLSPSEIGYRSTAIALSDLAAVAAQPIGVLVSLGCTDADIAEAAEMLMDGVADALRACGASLLGGDLTRSPTALIIDVTVVGRVHKPVLRSGAQPGDSIWVTGRLGAAAAAVRMLQNGRVPGDDARVAFAHPVPRIPEARWLAERSVMHALIDLSDGLLGDIAHIAAASGVAAVIEEGAVPVHPAALRVRGNREQLNLALSGGDDYELCFTAPPGAVEKVQAEFESAFALPLARVGYIEEGSGVRLRSEMGAVDDVIAGGYQHFEENAG
jgi:thiamine-monophosphate kinase